MNIIYFHSHDTGRQVSPLGAPVDTPQFERLAASGATFARAYCVAPTCSPSRSALLTGCLPHQNGMMGLAHLGWRCHDYSRHLVHVLRGAGYQSTLAGLQHLASGPEAATSIIGYDHELEAASNLASDVIPGAVRWLEERASQSGAAPFFLDVGVFETHISPRSPEGLFGHGEGQTRGLVPPLPLPDAMPVRQDYADFQLAARALDRALGEIMDALERTGLQDDTLLLVTTDHGLPLPGQKCNLTEAGCGVLLFLRGPGIEAGARYDARVCHLDIMPTLCEMIGLEAPDWCEGVSLVPLLRAECEQVRDDLFFEVTYHVSYEPQRAIDDGRWKYIRRFDERQAPVLPNVDGTRSKDFWHQSGWPERLHRAESLFDRHHDPGEAHDLSADPRHADQLHALRARLDHWMQVTNDPLLQGPVPAPPGAPVRDPDAYGVG